MTDNTEQHSDFVPTTLREVISVPQFLKALPGAYKRSPKALKAVWYLRTIKADTEISLTDIFLKTVKKYPDNRALCYNDNHWTYKEFNEWINRLAIYFQSLGFTKGDVAVVFLENRPEVLAISMALAKIGCVASLLNSSQKNKPLIHSINLSKPKVILVGAELIDSYLEIQDELNYPAEQVLIIPQETHTEKFPFKTFDILCKSFAPSEPKLHYKIHAKDVCMLVFTSGTTGLPKAAIISHSRWIKAYCGFGLTLMQLEPTDVMYVPLPFYHSTAMLVCWTSVIAGGATMVMKKKFSVKDFWSDIHKYQATSFGYVGELCKYLLNEPLHPLERNNTLTKMVGNGMRPGIWMEFKQRFGIERVGEFYASSEGNLAFFNMFNFDRTMGFSVNPYAIVEYDKENETPIYDKNGFMKKVGKGGTGLLLGEINDLYPFDGYTEKEKSEKSILRNVLKKGDAYFNTGDLVHHMGFNHTQFVDRLGDTFRWKSENVSTTEVEGIISKYKGNKESIQYGVDSNIAENIVYGVEIPNTSGRAGMVKLILTDSSKSIDFESFYEFLKKELPPFAIPLFIRIGKNTETTSTMKYLKSHLKADGYDCEKIEDAVYFLMPDTKKYTLVTPEIRDNINSGVYKL
jgi:citronellyl-CoA synthetase